MKNYNRYLVCFWNGISLSLLEEVNSLKELKEYDNNKYEIHKYVVKNKDYDDFYQKMCI